MSDRSAGGSDRPSGTEGEVFDLVDRKGPITVKGLMEHIGEFSRDTVTRSLQSLESDGYVVEEEVEFEYAGGKFARFEWSVRAETEQDGDSNGD